MKKIYYIYVCLGVLLLTALPAKAASEAEFGKLAKTYTLHKDGSQEMRVYKELTLFTHAAMNGLYGESFIVYNPAYQELKIHESYTRQKDGKIVKTPENAFVEVLPAAAADAPAYNGLKEMVVVHTGLELGATICLRYSRLFHVGMSMVNLAFSMRVFWGPCFRGEENLFSAEHPLEDKNENQDG